MGFVRFIVSFLKSNSIPIFKSIIKAYKDTTSGPRTNQSQSNGKKHPMDELFKSFLSKSNLATPELDIPTAYKILNIEPKQKQIDPKLVLDRYYILFKKNDLSNGGTAYLQSKVFAAKQKIMETYPNAIQIQQQFYKEVVEPEQKAEQQKLRKQQQQQNRKRQLNNKQDN